jgi:uncharacterized protein (DUF58 family)
MANGVGANEDCIALRDYRHGDPLRLVHWRSSARTGRLVVKECQDEQFLRQALVLDTGHARTPPQALEAAISIAASFACTIPDQEVLLDLLCIAERAIHLTAGRGAGQAQPMLEALAVIRRPRQDGTAHLRDLVAAHRQRMGGALVVLVHWDRERQELVRQLAHGGIPCWVLVVLRPGAERPVPPADVAMDRLIPVPWDQVGPVLAGLDRPAAGPRGVR